MATEKVKINPDQTHFSITKLTSFIPKFKEAFTISSLLWNQGARSLPGFVVKLCGQKA